MKLSFQRETTTGCTFVQPLPICTYWDVENSSWDLDGCRFGGAAVGSNEYVQCVCNHLTSFGIIFDWQGSADPQEPGKL